MKTLLCLLFTSFAFGQSLPYRLVTPKSISSSKKSFVINLGRDDQLTEGSIATFTYKGISFLARIISLNKFHSMWNITNKELLYPFKAGTTLTMYNNSNYIWEINEQSEKQRLALEKKRNLNKIILKRISIKAHYFFSLSQSVSQIDIDEEEQRTGLGLKILYEHPITHKLSLIGGLQYWRESVEQKSAKFTSQKYFLLGGIEFNSEPIEDLYSASLFSGLLLGIGSSSTKLPNDSFNGSALILPEFYIGLDFPMNHKWSFLIQSSLTSASTSESISDTQKQKTTQINLEFVGGLKYHF